MTTTTTTRTPVVFIPGLWLHASSWQAWVDLFTEAGYAPVAPGWPGIPELVEFDDRGHSLTIDHGWRAVADECLSWLAKQGL